MAYDKTQLTKEELLAVQAQQRAFYQLKVSYGQLEVAKEEFMAEYRMNEAAAIKYQEDLDEKYKDEEDKGKAATDEEKQQAAEFNAKRSALWSALGNTSMKIHTLDKQYSELIIDNRKMEKRLGKKYGHDAIIDVTDGKITRKGTEESKTPEMEVVKEEAPIKEETPDLIMDA